MIKRLFFIVFIFSAGVPAMGQAAFQTIVTKGPVEAGESFQVQYVLEVTEEDSEFFAPDFKGFRFVSGPNIYTGSSLGPGGPKKLKNIVFTLVATMPGKFLIPGASARIGNSLVKSKNVFLEVISQSAARIRRKKDFIQEANEDKFLSPGEDPYAKIQRNLFIKVQVDKRNCVVGEPVTATFKLYSRLDSKSDIVKNPGFYGFTVQDMINLDDRLSGIETINGKKFDVHTVRKVQLYPLQAGIFSIDAMEVHNKIRFSKSAVNSKAEQEIVEGVFTDTGKAINNNTTEFENDMATEPLAINVRPTPLKNKPVDYDGATGNFTITSSLLKTELAKNEEGALIITIKGKGNFSQLAAPVVKWPAGIEWFEPTIKDSLDHTQSPLNGKREFHFRFVPAKGGNYTLPVIELSFFNPDSNKYKTASSRELKIIVGNAEKITSVVGMEKKKATNQHNRWQWWALRGLALLALAGVIMWLRKKRKAINPEPVTEKLNATAAVVVLMQPANAFCEADDKTFYSILRNCIWSFFTQYFGLMGSKMNKGSLMEALQNKNVDEKSQREIVEILDRCQAGVFTNFNGPGDRTKLLEQTKDVLVTIFNQSAV